MFGRALKIQHHKRRQLQKKKMLIWKTARNRSPKKQSQSRSWSRCHSWCRSAARWITRPYIRAGVTKIFVSLQLRIVSRSVGQQLLCYRIRARREQYKTGSSITKVRGCECSNSKREYIKLKMKAFIIASVCLIGLCTLGSAQFQNGRLEPPNPQLCAQRIIHEKTPDGKGWVDLESDLIPISKEATLFMLNYFHF